MIRYSLVGDTPDVVTEVLSGTHKDHEGYENGHCKLVVQLEDYVLNCWLQKVEAHTRRQRTYRCCQHFEGLVLGLEIKFE